MKNLKFMLALCVLAISNVLMAQVVTPPWSVVSNATSSCGIGGNTNVVIDEYINPSTMLEEATEWSATAGSGNHYYVDQTIRIDKDAELLISGIELRFAPGTGVIVEVGGLLTIENGAVLSSACENSLWNGIEVKGSSSDLQTYALQGVLEISDSEISNAWVAISQSGGCAQEGGGIIKAEDSDFINNPNGISFTEYQVADNISFITNCEFVIDDGFQDFNLIRRLPTNASAPTRTESDWSLLNEATGDASQITIEDNKGLLISGCRFYNYFSADAAGTARSAPAGTPPGGLSTYPSPLLWAHPDWQGSAIVAHGSEFSVEAIDVCQDLERNKFIGWYYGIDAQITNSAGEEINISGCDFTDNKYGVNLTNYTEAYIDENTFEVTDHIWNRYIATNENYEEGPSSFNQGGIYVLHEFDKLYIRGNTFDIDLEYNFASHSFISYLLEGNSIPNELVIEANTFNATIENRPTLATIPVASPSASGLEAPTEQRSIVRMYGVTMNNWTVATDATHEVFMDCNEFDLYQEGSSLINSKHYYRYDISINKGASTLASTTIDIQSLGVAGSEPYNSFTADYSLSAPYGCGTGTGAGVNYFAYHIGADLQVNYPYHASTPTTHRPTCNTASVTSTASATVSHGACTPFGCSDFAGSGDGGGTPAPMGTTNVEDSRQEGSLSLFPNPASQLISVQSTTNGTYKVMSLDGREVIHSSQLNEGTNQINISQLSRGEYILHFIGSSSTEVHKFVKE